MKISDFAKRNTFLLVLVTAFIFYGVSAGVKINEQSKTPQHIYLAYSFLHGSASLVELPKSAYDMINFEDKWYVIGGITPALLLLPFVAAFGTGISDVFFGVCIGALNVALMYSLLGRLVEKSSTRLWLTFLFAAGTSHWWLSSVGAVWFNAQIVALLFLILYVRSAVQDRPWLSGLWMGLAFLSRASVLFSALFYLLIVLTKEHAIQPILKRIVPFGIMLAISITVMLTYNQIRFGNPLDFGYSYMIGSNPLTRTYARSGGFNIQYVPCNMYVSLLGLPNIRQSILPSVNEACAYLEPIQHDFGKLSSFFNPLGMSMFLATPAFLLIFRAKLWDNLVLPAWVAMISVLFSIWIYHAPGWVQFGYRFTSDFMVFLFVLLACSMKQTGYLEKILIVLSSIMGAIGLYLMYYMNFGLIWYEMFVKMARMIYHFVF
jgi:hypothetical protein